MKFSELRKIYKIATDVPAVPAVWEGMRERSWPALHDSVRAAQELDLEGVRSVLLTRVATAARAAEADGHDCPDTVAGLHRLLSKYDRPPARG
jgi:hypothetical protein